MVAVNQNQESGLPLAQMGHKAADPLLIPMVLDELRPTYEKLRRHFDDLTVHNAMSYHKAGELVLQGCQDPAVKAACPSLSRAMKAWAEALGMPERTLYHCRRVAEEYSADALRRLVEEKGITWGHVCHLINVTDDGTRQKLIERIGEEQLTTRELADEIVPEEKPKPRGPGRAPSVPKNVRQGLGRATSAAAAFSRQVREAWFSPRFNLAHELETASPDEIGNDTSEQLSKAIGAFEQLAEDAPKIVARLQQAAARVDEVLRGRDADAGDVPADEALDDEADVSDDDPDDVSSEDDPAEVPSNDDDLEAEPVVADPFGKEFSDE